MKSWPLRRRVAMWSAAATGGIVVAFGIGTATTLYVEQVRAADAELVRDVRLLRAEGLARVPATATHLAAAYRPWLQISVTDRAGKAAGGTGDVAADTARRQEARPAWSYRWVNWTLWRIHRETIGAYAITLARSLDMRPDVGDELAVAYLLSTPIALALAALAAWWLARKALRPIEELASAARGITADQLGTRLPVPRSNDELAQLADVLNGMLDRLERAFHQTRRFAADASHELRTPLTIMRGEIEAALREGGLSAGQEKRIVSLLEESDRLDRIAESLLMLARFDSGSAGLEVKSLDLTDLVREAAEDAELLGAGKRIGIEAEIPPAVQVRGDRVHLRRLLLNLLDNAVKFNRDGGRVRFRLAADSGWAVLVVGNTGPGIDPHRRALLFERFSRLGPSRATDRGSGLGLSLCREIAQAHGGTIELGKASGSEWTEFVVRLPLARPA